MSGLEPFFSMACRAEPAAVTVLNILIFQLCCSLVPSGMPRLCRAEFHAIELFPTTIKETKMDKDVKMYSLSTCSHCRATKKFLGECGVKYEFTDVDLLDGDERKAILEDIKKFNPRCSFPTI